MDAQSLGHPDTLVATRSGPVSGSTVVSADLRSPVHVFKGIPYAASPVGHLRFAPAIAPEPWTSVLDATSFGPMAPQIPGVLETMSGAVAPTVDESGCLTLNVWTPGCDDGRRPVLVWIHGGAFLTGSGSLPWYDGTRFAGNGDVVVVTINYRLGAFGFLHLDDVPGSGSAGLSDQMAALRWVQDNITGFGGDPGRVTVFGESAGAMSIGALLGTSSARGLFRRAILQSGACAHVHGVDTARRVTEALLVHLGFPGATAEQLRAVPQSALLEAQRSLLADGRAGSLPFQPVVGDGPLAEHPLDAIAAGRGAAPEAVLHGTTADEMRLFTAWDPSLHGLTREALVSRAAARHGGRAGEAVAAYEAVHPSMEPRDLWSAMETDAVFRAPAHALARALTNAGVPSWQYLFAWPTPLMGGRLGACHAIEIPFVFDNLHQQGAGQFLGATQELAPLAEAVHRSWVRFAHGDAPRSDWPGEHEDDEQPVWRFHVDDTAGLHHRPFAKEQLWWTRT